MELYLRLVEMAKKNGVEEGLAKKVIFEILVELARVKMDKAIMPQQSKDVQTPESLVINVSEEIKTEEAVR